LFAGPLRETRTVFRTCNLTFLPRAIDLNSEAGVGRSRHRGCSGERTSLLLR
jgi:hypothetical protein